MKLANVKSQSQVGLSIDAECEDFNTKALPEVVVKLGFSSCKQPYSVCRLFVPMSSATSLNSCFLVLLNPFVDTEALTGGCYVRVQCYQWESLFPKSLALVDDITETVW